jgi:transposase
VSRWLARREQTVLVRIARDLVGRCRSLTRAILEHERELAAMTAQIAPALLELPGCGALTAAKLLAEIGPIERFQTDAQLARHGGAANKAFSQSCGITAGNAKSRRSFTPILATKLADLQGVFSGSDGTRTRDLRRDRPAF